MTYWFILGHMLAPFLTFCAAAALWDYIAEKRWNV